MEKFVIQGGVPLKGKIRIPGAKNSALPLMCASILAEGNSCLLNVPDLLDVVTMQQVLEGLGIKVTRKDRTLEIDSTNLSTYKVPYELVKKMRASILVLGPLLARYGKAKICLPGGCCIGRRPVNLHLEGLRKLGARIKAKRGYIEAYTKGLKGSNIHLDLPSVGATENLMLSACLSEGETLIKNACRAPEIVDLARFLRKMRAEIQGEGTSVVTETIFENRFIYVPELQKMGAKIKQEGAKVVVEGVPCLSGNLVRASDIRAGAALVLAGLAAQGTTTIEEIHHIDRGYEELEENLSRLGANMVRIKE